MGSNMNNLISEHLYAQSIGNVVLRWAKEYRPQLLAAQVNSDAVFILQEIQRILDDDTLNDAECFYRIDAIVSVFHGTGLSTSRHSEVE